VAMTPAVTVVIADDHGLVRRGTRDILEQDDRIEVIGEAVDGPSLVDLIARLQPDVALVDLGMPGLSGIDALTVIRERAPGVAVVMLTIHDDIEYIWQAIQSGAAGYLLKDVADVDLIEAVVRAAGGATTLAPALAAKLVGRIRETTGDPEAESLTTREMEVLQLVARGDSNRQIAEALNLSPRTVEVHLTHLYRKLGADSRTKAAAIAFRRGLVTADDEPG
jgi:DNA-binding NarL/FixJ family response regulator